MHLKMPLSCKPEYVIKIKCPSHTESARKWHSSSSVCVCEHALRAILQRYQF